jgi:hypothetical protein
LTIQTGAGAAATQTVALSGTGVTSGGSTPSYSVSTISVDFGNQPFGVQSASMPVVITNTGSVSLPISGITLAGTTPQSFSQTNNCGSSIAVHGNCTVNVAFDAGSPGAVAASLVINAGTSPTNVSLSGTGTFQVSLVASAPTVTAGVPVTLTWSSEAGASCSTSGGNSSDGWSGTLAASGSQAVTESAAGSYNYSLTCTSSAGSASASATVAVTVPAVTLSASPTSITVGQSATLTWSSQNATSCVGTGGQAGNSWDATQSLQGTSTVKLNSSGMTVFTLTCSSGPMSTAATATVTVSDASSGTASSGGGGGGGGGALGGLDLLLLSTLAARAAALRRRANLTLSRGERE